MSKMRTPEMEVVRFTQSDVIVASGGSMGASGFNDGERTNSILNIGGQSFTLSTFKSGGGGLGPFVDFINSTYGTSFTTNNAGTNILFYDGAEKTLDYVYEKDSLADGTYKWNATNQRFEKQ